MDEQKQLNEIAEHFSMVYGRQFNPKTSKSTKWKRWYAFVTPQTCTPCLDKNGTLFNEEHPLDETPPLHEHCRCYLSAAIAITAGTATIDGLKGADLYFKMYGKLPNNYITKKMLKKLDGHITKEIYRRLLLMLLLAVWYTKI